MLPIAENKHTRTVLLSFLFTCLVRRIDAHAISNPLPRKSSPSEKRKRQQSAGNSLKWQGQSSEVGAQMPEWIVGALHSFVGTYICRKAAAYRESHPSLGKLYSGGEAKKTNKQTKENKTRKTRTTTKVVFPLTCTFSGRKSQFHSILILAGTVY